MVRVKSAHLSATARTNPWSVPLTHSKSDWQIVLQKFKKAMRLIFFAEVSDAVPSRHRYKRCSFLDLQLHIASAPRVLAAPETIGTRRSRHDSNRT
jgi:hypothetical protein